MTYWVPTAFKQQRKRKDKEKTSVRHKLGVCDLIRMATQAAEEDEEMKLND